jgi:hypothetical protein
MLDTPKPDRTNDSAIYRAQYAASQAADQLLLAAYSEHAITRDMRLSATVEYLRTVAAELEALGYRADAVEKEPEHG